MFPTKMWPNVAKRNPHFAAMKKCLSLYIYMYIYTCFIGVLYVKHTSWCTGPKKMTLSSISTCEGTAFGKIHRLSGMFANWKIMENHHLCKLRGFSTMIRVFDSI